MPVGRRLSILLVVLVVVGAPAVVLRLFCVGSSCDAGRATATATVPFCSLPHELRRAIVAGYREGRSADVMAATAGGGRVVTATTGGLPVAWPGASGSDASETAVHVPLAFVGTGDADLPDGVRLDAIAPTLEVLTGERRDHPEVRTGSAIEGVRTAGDVPLIVLIAWKGLGSGDLAAAPHAWPFLRRAIRRSTGTLRATTGSLPLDPASILTTIGSGALPSAHGITGTTVRTDDGTLRRAWSGPGAGSVIATFADDLDHDTAGEAEVAAVLADPADRGLIGDGWYLDGVDRDRVAVVDRPRLAAAAASGFVRTGDLGADGTTDVLGVVLEGSVRAADAATAEVVATVRRDAPDAVVVVAGTGTTADTSTAIEALALADEVDDRIGAPIVAVPSADGLFLDRDVLIGRSLTTQRVADVLASMRRADDARLFVDVYPSFAVAFARYC